MDQLRLIPPTKADEGKVMDYRAELLARGGGAGGCRKLLETADYDRWLDPGTRRRTPGWVESSVYLAMRPADKRLGHGGVPAPPDGISSALRRPRELQRAPFGAAQGLCQGDAPAAAAGLPRLRRAPGFADLRRRQRGFPQDHP